MRVEIIKIKEILFRALSLLLICYMLLSAFGQIVYAERSSEIKAILQDTVFYEGSDSGCGYSEVPSTANNYVKGSKIYIIGDSLTVGMRDLGNLKQKLESNGWSITNTPQINAISGKSLSWGKEQLSSSTERTSIQGSDTILVGLGTNDWGDYPNNNANFETKLNDIVTAIKNVNQSATIFWTNLSGTGKFKNAFMGEDGKPGLNESIEKIAQQNNIRVIKWSDVGETYITATEDVHPSGKYPEMADYISTSLNTGATTMNPGQSLAGCSCSAGLVTGNYTADQRYEYTWGYFVTVKQLSPEATAGLMGNLEAESGINPQNMQNTAPLPDGPVFPTVIDSATGKTVPDPRIKGSYGYGIAQWTSAGRQQNLIDYALETGRSTGDLALQLDFIWKELSESYKGVLAKLQEPGVTVEAASDEVILRFERPADQSQAALTSRQNRSKNIYNKYNGTPGTILPSASCNSYTTTTLDINAPDTTNIPCAPGTTEFKNEEGYRLGKLHKIKLCTYNGTKINSQVSANFKAMIDASKADGISLSGVGFRSFDQQISLYQSKCNNHNPKIEYTPPPYPKERWRDYISCPGAAPPGFSNHEMGFAIDFSCSGSLIPGPFERASNNSCFQWLLSNANKYGFKELGDGKSRTDSDYEGWHWSVDGS